MYPYINLFGRDISSYSIMAIIGLILVFAFTAVRCCQNKYSYNDQMYFLVFCFAFVLIASTLLYQVTMIPVYIKAYPDIKSVLSTGLVFYGGLFGIILGAIVYAHVFKQDARKYFWISTPSIPLFHVMGRIGCFLAGCCYGREDHVHGVVYHESIGAPNGIPFLPIQLYEAAGNFVIFVVLCIFQKYNRKYYKSLGIYFVMYGTMRFILEFFRGDTVRGIWGPFSTSQWISLIVIPLGIYCLIRDDEKNFLAGLMNRQINPEKAS